MNTCMFAVLIATAASTSTAQSQIRARRVGGGRRRTGRRSAASVWISSSLATVISALARHARLERLQRPVQVDLQRDLAPAGLGGRLGERAVADRQQLDGLALARREGADGLAE